MTMTSETQYYADRLNLRCLLTQYPNWTNHQYAQATNRSLGWVKKWKARFKATALSDQTVLLGHSRIRKTPTPSFDQKVVNRILIIRLCPPDNLARTPGPRTIAYYLEKDPELAAVGLRLPRSTATISRILDKEGLIIRPQTKHHQPHPLLEPGQHQQWDFKDVVYKTVDENGTHYHYIEALNGIDCGSDKIVHAECCEDFDSYTSLLSVAQHLHEEGCPKSMTIDRDPRWVGSAQGRDFPSAFVRMLQCFGIEVKINPPHRPDLNCYVERYHKSYGQECLQVEKPQTLADACAVTALWVQHYNNERPNQARSCGNKPPLVAHPNLPILPALPAKVDPDKWLYVQDGRCFTRRVSRNGTVEVDKSSYYLKGVAARSQVSLVIDAATNEFAVYAEGGVASGRIGIKGLHGHVEMELEPYIEMMAQEAKSKERRRREGVNSQA
jgi:transposase InsO family protein